jgi:hypothetical protein
MAKRSTVKFWTHKELRQWDAENSVAHPAEDAEPGWYFEFEGAPMGPFETKEEARAHEHANAA